MSSQKYVNISRGPVIEKNRDLSQLNTMGVPVQAKRFTEIIKPRELSALYSSGFFEGTDPIILGGGSNLLFLNDPDRPVIKISIPGITITPTKEDLVLMKVGAGEAWHNVVSNAVENNLGGIENLALIPGTTGAAPIQNIGAYGVELDDCFHQLTAFHIQSGEFKTYRSEECRFGYRDSIFKQELKGKVVVCDVTLRLTKKNHQINTGYKSLAGYLQENCIEDPGIEDVFNAVVAIRQNKLPDPADIGNAGSFFKNPVVNESVFKRLQKTHSEIPRYRLGDDKYKIPAGWLIEQTGWKGKRVGNVGTYKNQALVLVNHGGATGKEIFEHAMRIRNSVREKFGVELQPEVNIVGRNE